MEDLIYSIKGRMQFDEVPFIKAVKDAVHCHNSVFRKFSIIEITVNEAIIESFKTGTRTMVNSRGESNEVNRAFRLKVN